MLKKSLIWGFLIFIMGVTVYMMYFGRGEDYSIVKDQSIPLNEGWTVTSDSFLDKQITLPANFDGQSGEIYHMSITLPKYPGRDAHLLLRASMQDITVELDDELLYKHVLKGSELRPYMPKASLWVLVPLPESFAGSKLEVTLKSDIKVFSGTLNAIRLGEKSDLLFHVIQSQWIGILVFLILFITGFVVIALTTVLKSFNDNRILYLGFLSVVTSAWILSESRVLQFFTGNRFILGGISYMMVPLIGFFIVLFVKEAIANSLRIKRILKWVAAGFGLILLAMMYAQSVLKMPFILAMQTASVFMIGLMGIVIGSLYYEYKKLDNENVKHLKKYIWIVMISIGLEAVVFYLGAFDYTSTFLRVGILTVLSGLLVDSYLYLKESIETQKEHQLLEVLAYKDFLTGGGNRTAYERDLEMLMNRGVFRLVLMDMNYLKKINDDYGHTEGDRAIMAVYTSIEASFSDCGQCYRIGGDEFAVLIKDIEETRYQKCLSKLNNQLNKEAEHVKLPLEIAVGSDVYMTKTWPDYRKFYHHVDQKMYDDKLKKKRGVKK